MISPKGVLAAVAATLVLLVLGCGGPSPEAVTRSFLEASKNGQWVEASRYVESSSMPASMRTLQNQATSTAEKDKDYERLAKLLFSKVSYTMGSTKVEGDSATVRAHIKAIDQRKIFAKYISDMLPLAFASAFTGSKAEDLAPQANKYFEDAIIDPQAPMTTTDIDVKLVRSQGQWRISANDDLLNAMTGNLGEIAKAFQSLPTPSSGVFPAAAQTILPTPTATSQPIAKPTPTVAPQPTARPTPAVGFSRSRPAPIGAGIRAVYKEKDGDRAVVITVKEALRGAEAWNRIRSANSFNDAPYTGHEYILAKIQFKYESGPADLMYDLDDRLFAAVSAQGKLYEMPSLVLPKPSIETKLYPGASHEGWAALMVTADDPAPVMAFGLSRDGSGGLWFKVYAE